MNRARLLNQNVIVMVLAGGEGQRLHPLTSGRAKPGVRFAGAYRMIDFTLSNCVNSGLRRIHLLTQYASSSLARHVRSAWSAHFSDAMGEYMDLVPPQRVFADRWYAGTADAIFQNMFILQEERPDYVLVLSGDHAYKMDYSQLLAFHQEKQAVLSISCLTVPREAARQLGVLKVDATGRVVGFLEKPEDPPGLPDNPEYALANMGVYAWSTPALAEEVSHDARLATSHDFGRDLIPAMVEAGKAVYACPFEAAGRGPRDYWRDIGTLESYWQAHMDLVAPLPELDLYDSSWPVYTNSPSLPPAKVTCGADLRECKVQNSLLSPGCIASGAEICRSVLSPGVRVESGAEILESIILDDVIIGENAHLNRVIVDEGVTIPPGYRIGFETADDEARFVVAGDGITVIPRRVILD